MAVFQIGSTEIVETKRNDMVRYEFDGTRIYRIRVESMPGVLTNVYLILGAEATLIDPGSHTEKNRGDLLKGFEAINSAFNEDIALGDIANIVITHAHIDHFGMLAHKDLRGKRLYMHPSDEGLVRLYLTQNAEWVHSVQEFCNRSGGVIEVDLPSVGLSAKFPADMWREYECINVQDGDEIVNGYQVYHTPGHSPGHICIGVGPILFVGDLIWSSMSAYQFPKDLMPGVGLENHLASLKKIAMLGTTLGLAGHRSSIYPVGDRVAEIEAFHHQRLREIVDLCRKDINLYQLADKYCKRHQEFIGASSLNESKTKKNKIVCLEDIGGAHVEHLLDHNRMIVSDNVNGVLMYRSNEAFAS